MVTFSAEATPSPKLDINPLIFFIRNVPPQAQFLWAKCNNYTGINALQGWIKSGFTEYSSPDLSVIPRQTAKLVPLSTFLCLYPRNSEYID